jgi:hypothetical protein
LGLHEFFDARDLVQAKYEMVRRVEVDGHSVAQTTGAFGCSRPSFYHAQTAFKAHGIPGLVPRKRGPRGAHKLDDAVMAFVRAPLPVRATSSARDADPGRDRWPLARVRRHRERLGAARLTSAPRLQ